MARRDFPLSRIPSLAFTLLAAALLYDAQQHESEKFFVFKILLSGTFAEFIEGASCRKAPPLFRKGPFSKFESLSFLSGIAPKTEAFYFLRSRGINVGSAGSNVGKALPLDRWCLAVDRRASLYSLRFRSAFREA
jgi:hypothetical protein